MSSLVKARADSLTMSGGSAGLALVVPWHMELSGGGGRTYFIFSEKLITQPTQSLVSPPTDITNFITTPIHQVKVSNYSDEGV